MIILQIVAVNSIPEAMSYILAFPLGALGLTLLVLGIVWAKTNKLAPALLSGAIFSSSFFLFSVNIINVVIPSALWILVWINHNLEPKQKGM